MAKQTKFLFLVLIIFSNSTYGQQGKCQKSIGNLIQIVKLEDIPSISLNSFQLNKSKISFITILF